MPYFNYVIYNEKGWTYNGYTVNLKKRLLQHNEVIKGGARATRGKGPWKYLVIMTSSEWICISDAMKVEWFIRYPTRKKPRPKIYNGIEGRLLSSNIIINKLWNESFYCYINDDHYSKFITDYSYNNDDICKNITKMSDIHWCI